LCALGDRLGILEDLAAHDWTTSGDLAMRVGIDPRYAREWLNALACAGYVEFDTATGSFRMTREYSLVLADEHSAMYLGGAYQLLLGLSAPLGRLAIACRTGEGVPQGAYDDNLRVGMERMSGPWFEHLLVQQWVGGLPYLRGKLANGASAADIGCGTGRAVIELATAFPASRFVGYDICEPALDRARRNAQIAGVADRVRFETRDVSQGLPGRYDLITTFNSVHDMVDTHAALSAIRKALRDEGTYLLLETRCAPNLEDNIGPFGTIMYGTSLLYNLPVAIANGGAGIGTMGLPAPRLRELCEAAEFGTVRQLPVANPFHALFEMRP
jgi:SAM-dependent methyltransferase